MIPILFCFPVFGSSPGYVCCLPTHTLLHILSFTILLLLLPILTVNTINSGEINLGFWAMHIFILGTILFIIFGTLGVRKFSEGLISASFAVWIITYAGFLMFSVYSVWNPMTMKTTSINGRCAMNLWLFDWCCKARGIHCTSGQSTGLMLFNDTRDLIDKRFIKIESDNEYVLDEYDFLYKFTIDTENQSLNGRGNSRKSYIKHNNATNVNTNSTMHKWYNNNKINKQNVYKEYQMMYSDIEGNEHNIDKRNSSDGQQHQYNKSIEALFGTLAIMMLFISLYTLYAVALNDVLTVLRYPLPVVFVARMQQSQDDGAATDEQRTPQIVFK